MVEETHALTVQGIGSQDTAQVTVPADVQREMGIAIDDEVEVAIHGVSGLIDRASFTGQQTAGDRVTIPADVVRQLGLVAGEQYDIGFDTPEDDEVPGAIPDEDVTDDEEVEEAIESAESRLESGTADEQSESEEAESEMEDEDSPGLGELFSTDDEEDEAEAEVEDEQEEEGLGELFG
jgi:bifunctional DNA-binding transcriptional regulator/antitoxin component of YhaV-PrlF toxin-antitoxin module